MEQLLKKYPQDFRFVFRHFPLNIHDKAILSAQAAEAAGLQGKFWEMHDLLMAKQAEWQTKTLADFEPYLRTQAGTITGLDVNKFMTDLKSAPVVKKVTDALDSAETIGLDHTPFLVINGRAFDGNPDEATFSYIIDLFKSVRALEPKRFKECPAMTVDKAKQYTATLNTSKGDIVISLYADKAPLTVNSFVFLAKNGWFDNIPFHRVVADFVVQSGDPSGTGIGNPGYQYNNEITAGLSYDKAGVVGMANAGANTNGSQFFITLSAQTQLTGSYTIFGQVTHGLDVLQKLTVRDPSTNIPADTITKVTITEK